ncbi:hypothetical protein C0991_001424 [Blastosporella zonata]|nr:hypothetical protein C0991_001424 [Blastosporella zonata]
MQFLHPTTLEEITAGPDATESVLVAMSLSPSSFFRLLTLDIYALFYDCPEFIPALRQCPTLTTLRIRMFGHRSEPPSMAPIPPDILPALVTYHGPLSLAQSWARDRRIRDFKLWGSRTLSSVLQPAELAPILRQLGPHVEVLEIGVMSLPPSLISIIAECLPKLKSLAVNAHVSSSYPGTATTHVTQTRFRPSISVGEGSSQLNLDSLSFGVQIPDEIAIGSLQHELIGLTLLEGFPIQYTSMSWDCRKTGFPWSKIMWNRSDVTDRRFDAPGDLSIGYVED